MKVGAKSNRFIARVEAIMELSSLRESVSALIRQMSPFIGQDEVQARIETSPVLGTKINNTGLFLIGSQTFPLKSRCSSAASLLAECGDS